MTHPAPRRAGILALFAFVLAGPGSASALDWAVGVDAGYFSMTNASKSAKAIFDGSSGGGTYGGFFQIGVGHSFVVSAHGRFFEKTGERVFVENAGGEVFRLGHPLTIRLIPMYGMVAYRIGQSPRWAPYFGAGIGATSYKETSDVAGLIETSTATKASYHFSAGVDFLSGPLRVGVEVTYSLVPNTIGESGVSKVYGESDVGGATIVGRLGFGSR
jgi:hypothetical protein